MSFCQVNSIKLGIRDCLKDYPRAESVKIECASRHFATISDSHVTYDVIKNYDELWDIITKP